MGKGKIKYLIKFIPEEEFIDRLIDKGELYMRPLGHFAELEEQQGDSVRGDIREGLLLDCARICAQSPIYCMYAVFDNDVVSDGVLINKRAVQGFFSEGAGYFALINYSDFISQPKADHFDGCAATFNIVSYGSIDREIQKQWLVEAPQQAVFVKQEGFSYQQEFRLIINKNMTIIKDEKIIEEYKTIHGEYFSHDFYTYDKYVKEIGSLEYCAKKYCTEDLCDYDDAYFILKTT